MKILTYPNDTLKAVSTEVSSNGLRTKMIVKKLIKTLNDTPKAIGLSAPQIGYNVRIFVMNIDGLKNNVFINPIILEKSSENQVYREGCLSFPKLYIDLESPKYIILEFLDEMMTKRVERLEGLNSTCACHEIDHLNGVLMIDRTPIIVDRK